MEREGMRLKIWEGEEWEGKRGGKGWEVREF